MYDSSTTLTETMSGDTYLDALANLALWWDYSYPSPNGVTSHPFRAVAACLPMRYRLTDEAS